MKKNIFVLVMCGLVLFSGIAMADGHEEDEYEEDLMIDITGGEIEFETTLFSMDAENNEDDDETTETEFLTHDGANTLVAEVEGTAFNQAIDWDVLVDGDEGDFDLGLEKSADDYMVRLESGIELDGATAWESLVNDAELIGQRTVGPVEAQTAVGIYRRVAMIEDDRTYISYDVTDALNTTFKPFDADFEIGDEFAANPVKEELAGVEVEYELSDTMTLNNAIHTEFNSETTDFDDDIDDTEGSDMSVVNKTSLTMDTGMSDLTVSALLDYTSESTVGENVDTEESGQTVVLDGNDVAAPVFALIAENDMDLTEDMGLASEVMFATGSQKYVDNENDDQDTENSTTKLGLWNEVSLATDFADFSASHTLEREVYSYESDINEDRDYTKLSNSLGAEMDKELEEGLNWITNAGVTLTSEELEIEDDTEDEEGNTEFDLTTKVQFSF